MTGFINQSDFASYDDFLAKEAFNTMTPSEEDLQFFVKEQVAAAAERLKTEYDGNKQYTVRLEPSDLDNVSDPVIRKRLRDAYDARMIELRTSDQHRNAQKVLSELYEAGFPTAEIKTKLHRDIVSLTEDIVGEGEGEVAETDEKTFERKVTLGWYTVNNEVVVHIHEDRMVLVAYDFETDDEVEVESTDVDKIIQEAVAAFV